MVQPSAAVPLESTGGNKVVFEQTIEGLFVRGLGDRLSDRARKRLKEHGLDLDKRLLPAYEFDRWMKYLRIAAEEVFPESPIDTAMFRIGERMVDGFEATFIGRAVLGMIRLMGPVRTLQRTTRNFRSGNNYTESKLVQVEPTRFTLWMNEVGQFPHFTAGIIHAGLRVAGAQEIRVDPTGHDGSACTYRIEWK